MLIYEILKKHIKPEILLTMSYAEAFASMPKDVRDSVISAMSDEDVNVLMHSWAFWARPKQKLPPGDWVSWLISAGRGFGKMTDIEDDILTEHRGWIKLKDVQDGDTVYGLNGQPCNVVKAHPIQMSREAYELTFDTGEKIKADAEHLWYTVSKVEEKRIRRGKATQGSVKTTRELFETQKYGSKQETNHRIPLCEPVKGAEIDLPIHPYFMGAWLGDGDSKDSTITTPDKEILERLEKCGHSCKKSPRDDISYRFSNGKPISRNALGQFENNGSLNSLLKDLNVYKNKHIPAIYQTASVSQRWELLKGLMDTDGYSGKAGRCEYVSVNRELAYDVLQLVNGLGIKGFIYEGPATLNGRICGTKYRVYFRTNKPVFHLTRKLEAQMESKKTGQISRQLSRFIVNIERTQPCAMRCLTVDSPDHLFLLTRSFIATHNTRTGAETVNEWKRQGYGKFALVGSTAADARDVMVEGPSGVLETAPPWDKPKYIASKRVVEWSNGAQAHLYSAEEPEALRGPEHEKAWVDEIIKFKYAADTMDMLMFGLRLGDNPQTVITTTPKPIKIIRELVSDPTTLMTTGSTYENKSNLAKTFFDRVIKKYEGTRLGEQELNAKILDDNPNALWNHEAIDSYRVTKVPNLVRVAVAIDPAVTSEATSAETGIIAGGIDEHGHGYVLDDLSLVAKPEIWAAEALKGYYRRDGDIVVGEVNNGGDLIESMLRAIDPNVSYKSVRATRGKFTRAEPVAMLYEQGRIHHVGMFSQLEEQMCEWVPGEKSPDRMDALVWLFTELLLKDEEIEHDYNFY